MKYIKITKEDLKKINLKTELEKNDYILVYRNMTDYYQLVKSASGNVICSKSDELNPCKLPVFLKKALEK